LKPKALKFFFFFLSRTRIANGKIITEMNMGTAIPKTTAKPINLRVITSGGQIIVKGVIWPSPLLNVNHIPQE
jgi:hypothetical protein